ncbi:MAG: MFS transporter [Candidatus Saccharibacteria bacterium]|nr:MFS transporter [Candidatus Saccharibacteria bacterium]
MLKTLISRIFRRHHYWRNIGFDELSELYTSMMFRNLALSLVGIFIPIYLYELGFSLPIILSFYVVMFLTRIPADFITGYCVAKFGPKHTMFLSYIAYVIALSLFTSYEQFNWPIYLLAVVWGISGSLFFIAFHVDFSKVKHKKHGGKELGVLTIMERLGATLGPITGGVVAALFGAQYTFLAATLFFMTALIPLFFTAEPVKTRQHLDYRGLPIKKLKQDFISHASLSVENSTHIAIWPLFLALFVFVDNIYLQIGALTSFAVIVSVILARVIGQTVDNKKGRRLLRIGSRANIILHGLRPMVSSFGLALSVNFIHEILTTSFRLPYIKGMYDRADELEGHRIVYIVSLEALSCIVRAAFYGLLAILALSFSSFSVFVAAFGLAAIASYGITLEKFPALNVKK